MALDQIDAANAAIAPLKLQIARLSRRQPGCRALQVHYGVGALTSVAIWAEMGDTRRFASSSDAVRHAGLDITVWASDTQRAKGHLARQGPSVLRWALYEAAMAAAKQASPDHDYWTTLRARLGAQRAALTIVRKLARRCHHTLRALGDDAWTTTTPPPDGTHTDLSLVGAAVAHPMICGPLQQPERMPPTSRVDSLQRPSGRTQSRGTPHPPSRRRSRGAASTEVSLGVHAPGEPAPHQRRPQP